MHTNIKIHTYQINTQKINQKKSKIFIGICAQIDEYTQ